MSGPVRLEERCGASGDEVADVVVLGTGAAGLAAALAAAIRGARVLLVEKTALIGGTTAISGGTVWIPANLPAAATGANDSPAAALAYLRAGGGGSERPALLEAFVASGAKMLFELERASALRFVVGPQSDYHPELPGGRLAGRSLVPAPIDPTPLGALAERVRSATMPLDRAEQYGSLSPVAMPSPDEGPRWIGGRALVGGLLQAALARGAQIRTECRAQRLVVGAGGRVVGVECDAPEGRIRLGARRAVVLATGGFEWSRELVARFLSTSLEAPGSPPCIEGDGLRMAMAIGAGLGSMAEAWWSPMIRIPGEALEGEPYARMVVSQRLYPRSIVVNRAGRRFANEAKSYHDFGRDLMAIDSAAGAPANRPAWLVYDTVYRSRYGTACLGPDDPDPNWLRPFATPEALAAAHGIDADGLRETLRVWNEDVARGRDRAFGRGESAYALSKGDRAQTGLARTLGPIDTPPYYAVPLYAGTLGTRGGPQTDADGRVEDAFGARIPGLFAAGNVAASPTGLLYPGAGGTLGLALTFGWRAGLAAAGESVAEAGAKRAAEPLDALSGEPSVDPESVRATSARSSA